MLDVIMIILGLVFGGIAIAGLVIACINKKEISRLAKEIEKK